MVHTRTCIVIYLHSHLIAYLNEGKCKTLRSTEFQTLHKFLLSMSKNLSRSEKDKFSSLQLVQ